MFNENILKFYVTTLEESYIDVYNYNNQFYYFKYEGFTYSMDIYSDTVQFIALDVYILKDNELLEVYNIVNEVNLKAEFTKFIIEDNSICAITRFYIHTNSNPHFNFDFNSYLWRMRDAIILFLEKINNR